MTGYTEHELLDIAARLAEKYAEQERHDNDSVFMGSAEVFYGLDVASEFLAHNGIVTHGRENAIVPEQCNKLDADFELDYLNRGESYSPTVAYDYGNREFAVVSVGDWLECAEAEFSEDTDQTRCACCGEFADNEGHTWPFIPCNCGHYCDGADIPSDPVDRAAYEHPEFSDFWNGYTQALAFTSRIDGDDQGDSLFPGGGEFGDNYPDSWDEFGPLLDRDEIKELISDCTGFIESAREFMIAIEKTGRDYSWEQCGTDFHLSRNGHGAGFWDRGLSDPGDKLHELSKPYGSAELMGTRDDDGELSSAFICH